MLIATNSKLSSDHRELFATIGKGKVTACVPGKEPEHVNNGTVIVDNSW